MAWTGTALADISDQFYFLIPTSQDDSILYTSTLSITVRILVVRVLGGTEPCILNNYVSESALNALNSSAFL
jgi:hypothetical protein